MKMTSAAFAFAPLDARLAGLGGGRVDTPARRRKPIRATGKAMKTNKNERK